MVSCRNIFFFIYFFGCSSVGVQLINMNHHFSFALIDSLKEFWKNPRTIRRSVSNENKALAKNQLFSLFKVKKKKYCENIYHTIWWRFTDDNMINIVDKIFILSNKLCVNIAIFEWNSLKILKNQVLNVHVICNTLK